MQNDHADATVSEHNKRKKRPLLGIFAVIFGVYLLVNGIVSLTDNLYPLVAPKGRISIEKVDTPELLQKGLSNRPSMPANRGMLFIFEKDKAGCFWMKETKISLDMIWMNSDKKVVHIKKDAKPESYPESFCPDEDATYVLEVNSGQSDRLGIAEGTTLKW